MRLGLVFLSFLFSYQQNTIRKLLIFSLVPAHFEEIFLKQGVKYSKAHSYTVSPSVQNVYAYVAWYWNWFGFYYSNRKRI